MILPITKREEEEGGGEEEDRMIISTICYTDHLSLSAKGAITTTARIYNTAVIIKL